MREARERAGMTQTEVATQAGTSQPTLSAYEQGRMSPSLTTASRILAVEGFELTVRPLTSPPATVGYGSYRGRPIELPVELPGVEPARAFATVSLPLHLQWSSRSRRYDLSVRADRARLYSVVLREGTPADVVEWIDARLLIDLWDDLVLPAPIRAAWRRHLERWGVSC